MMKGLTLSQLAAKIEANKVLKQDYVAETPQITMQISVNPTLTGDKPIPVLEVANTGSFPLLPLAHDQIGSRLKIPGQYYDKMLTSAPDLLATNVNAWFRLNPEKRMLRTLGGDLRAFLSNRYNRIENEEIAEIVLPILADIPDVQIVSSEVTERRMYIQAVSPRVQGEVKKGDVVQAGVVISNSEVGCGSVSVAAMDWRLWCLNGAIAAEKFRAYHVGRKIEDNAELWADDTRQADDRTVLLKVRDMVRNAVDAVRFRSRIEQMQGLTQINVTGNPAKAVEVLAKKIGVNDTEQGGILRSLIDGGDLSAWGMLNAVTHQAHSAASYDRAVQFEAAGGQLLELPRNQWREVLEAA
jgi:hypothetical protein